MKRILPLLILAAIVGCAGSVPAGQKEFDALVKPHGRTIAVIPFTTKAPADAVDGLKLAVNAADSLSRQLKGVKVLGPTDLGDLPSPLNEASWVPIAKKCNAQLLLVGEITFLETYVDKKLQTQEGQVGLKFRVIEVKGDEAKPVLRDTTWTLAFPEEPNAKFDPIYGEMKPDLFRHEMLNYAGQKLSGIFYRHFERTYPINTFTGTYRETSDK